MKGQYQVQRPRRRNPFEPLKAPSTSLGDTASDWRVAPASESWPKSKAPMAMFPPGVDDSPSVVAEIVI
jgi:hypothetical protein